MNQITQHLKEFNTTIHDLFSGPAIIAVLLFVGVFLTFKCNFFPIRNFKLWFSYTFASLFSKKATTTSDKKAISPFQTLATALAGTMGTGNIVGVATALTLGGPGAIFWMWMAGIVGMATKFAEVTLSVRYRERNKNGEWVGGPMYYMSKGLNMKWLAGIFAVILILATLGTGNMTQSNSVSASLYDAYGIPPLVSGIVLAVLVGISIFGGLKRIASITGKIIPFISLFYIIAGILIVLINFKEIPNVISSIFKEAFNFKAASGGIIGTGFITALRYGVSRGIFTNEAGLGTSCLVHSASDVKEPVEQGMWGIFEVFADTLVVCTITAFALLSTGVLDMGVEEASMVSVAFSSVFGKYAGTFVTFSIALFAFATLLGWSYYGEKGLEYLVGGRFITPYRLFFAGMIIVGSVADLHFVWSMADTFNGLLGIPNLIALVLLSPEITKITKAYLNKIKRQK